MSTATITVYEKEGGDLGLSIKSDPPVGTLAYLEGDPVADFVASFVGWVDQGFEVTERSAKRGEEGSNE